MQARARQMFSLLVSASMMGALVLSGCTPKGDAPSASPGLGRPDAGAAALTALAKDTQAHVGRILPKTVLRQVDLPMNVARTTDYTFRFTDPESTQAITIFASSNSRPGEWRVISEASSKLLGHTSPGMDLQALVVGPDSAEKLAQTHWGDGDLRMLSLVGRRYDLHWNVFWNLADGVVSGTVDARTGGFTPSPAPPAVPPATVIVK